MEARAEIEGAVLMQTGGGYYEEDGSGSSAHKGDFLGTNVDLLSRV